MNYNSFLQGYKSTLANRYFFDMIPSCKRPCCILRQRQWIWKQADFVFWYQMFPSGEEPRFQRRDKGCVCLWNRLWDIGPYFIIATVLLRYSKASVQALISLTIFTSSPPFCIYSTTLLCSSHVVGVYLSNLLLFPTLSSTLAVVGWSDRIFEDDGAGRKCGG